MNEQLYDYICLLVGREILSKLDVINQQKNEITQLKAKKDETTDTDKTPDP